MKEETDRWTKAIIITLFVFFLISLYLYLRRGYYNLYIVNKVFGSVAVVLAGFTLLIRPFSQKIEKLTQFMTIRRHLGLSAFGMAITHTVVSALFLPKKFPISWYQNEIVPIIFGLLAIFLWVYLAYISSNEKVRKMGVEIWKKHQSFFGKAAFLAIFLHLVAMKYQGWINWWNGKIKATPELANPLYPPASIFVFIFMLVVILYRIFHFLRSKNS